MRRRRHRFMFRACETKSIRVSVSCQSPPPFPHTHTHAHTPHALYVKDMDAYERKLEAARVKARDPAEVPHREEQFSRAQRRFTHFSDKLARGVGLHRSTEYPTSIPTRPVIELYDKSTPPSLDTDYLSSLAPPISHHVCKPPTCCCMYLQSSRRFVHVSLVHSIDRLVSSTCHSFFDSLDWSRPCVTRSFARSARAA